MAIQARNETMTERDRVGILESKVEDMHHQLFGNGQPGQLAEIRRELRDLNKGLVKVTVAIASIAGGGGGVIGFHLNSVIGGG